MSNFSKSKRFQYQPWYIKLWRYRHYIPIPYIGFRIWISQGDDEDEDFFRLSLKNSLGLAKGLAQAKMNWVYDWDDIKADFDL